MLGAWRNDHEKAADSPATPWPEHAPPHGAAVDLDWRASHNQTHELTIASRIHSVPQGEEHMFKAYDLSGSTTIVAGGAGFVGSAIVRELLDRGLRVVCFDNYLHGVPEHVAGLGGEVAVVHGDALDEWALADAIERHHADYIIDCIGDTFVPTAYQMPQRFFDINLKATYNILRAAELCGVKRTLYVSSTEVYGQLRAPKATEETPLAPVNTYAVSKLAADRLCYTFAVEHGIPVVIARIFNAYGPRETQPYIIPEIIAQLHRCSTLCLGNTKAERDFTYVHDTARGLIALLESSLPNGDVANVGSDCSYSVEWLATTIAELMDVPDLRIEHDPKRLRRMDIDRFQCDNSKLRRYTGWEPSVDIRTGLAATIDWFRANGCRWSWESFVDGTNIYR
ncbi:NAD-dependent epimerase/dehydratase family protein [Sorangium sp. So ce1128]